MCIRDSSKTVTCWGSGNVLREFLFVDDLSKAILFILDNNINESILNVGSSEEVSIFELANIIKKITGFNGEVRFDNSKPNGIDRKFLDSSKLNSYGWNSEIDLEKGLNLTYSWFVDNKSNLRL